MTQDKATIQLKCQANKQEGFEYQERRHQEWTENYQLYRDKVITNRLTQRQSVNVPLMKETIKTVLSRIDEAPDLHFESLGNDPEKEIYTNEYWQHTVVNDKLEAKDIVDKKQEQLYGRSFKKLNVVTGRFESEVIDPQDILIDRYADPADIDGTAQYVIHQHIFRRLKELANNPNYDKEAIERLKVFFATEMGIIKSGENTQSLADRNQRLEDMGVNDVQSAEVGETIVEINEHYIRLWDAEAKDWVIHLATFGQDQCLAVRPLDEVLGKTHDNYWQKHFPFVTWASDIERTDIWPDGTADVVRTPNKVLNAWLSQLVENRTLRNFGMNYYDSTQEGFIPQTFEPTPFGWYPVPGRPDDVVKHIEIPDLSESIDEMQFLINMVERASAATATEKGEESKASTTLGEIQLITARAMERIGSTTKFYRLAWNEFGEKWYKMLEANKDSIKPIKLYKKSYRGNYFDKEISPKDFISDKGYRCKVMSSSEREQENIRTFQKFQAVISQFPNNLPLKKIYQKRLLDFIDLNPEESQEVMQFEEQQAQFASASEPEATALPAPTINPQENAYAQRAA